LIPNSLQENGDPATDDGMHRVVHYPFAVNEKVLIKVNRRITFHFGSDAFFPADKIWF